MIETIMANRQVSRVLGTQDLSEQIIVHSSIKELTDNIEKFV
jgi:hypothetical protein